MGIHNISAVVVDDELNSRQMLIHLLKRYCDQVNVIAEADTVEEAIALIQNKKPDLVFLDIQMPRGSGFNVLKQIGEIDFEVIFVTGFDRYAIQAIKFKALDYLLKPVDIEELKVAVNKVTDRLTEKRQSATYVLNLLNDLDRAMPEITIPVHSQDKVRFVKVGEISSFAADGRYTVIRTRTNENYTVAKTLKDFESLLEEGNFFLRISKSSMLNIHQISDYSKGETCEIQMFNGDKFTVSKRKKVEILSRLKQLNK